jgi:TP901 family phage tail tape measure protein
MAKTISDEQMKLTMIINGDSAQKEILDLEKATIKLKNTNSDLAYQRKLVKKQLGEESSEYKALTKEINQNSIAIDKNEDEIKRLISNLKLTDRTMEQLVKQSSILSRQLKLMDPNSADFKKYSEELSQVKTRMGELSGKASVAKSSVSSLADGFNKYQGIALSIIAALTGVVLSIQKIIDINGKLSDAQSDVMKTTGMTKKEVDELTKSFGLLQTRTSRIDLLGIAEQGGRIGIAKAEIGDFVNVMNKASVALGDSFTGGAEEVANKLGKIKFLFQETKDLGVEQAYNSIGSAINDLGANGTASEANIADFTTRIGSLTDVLKPTIQETLALGTAFEESGIESEVSARAYGIFMKQASTESGKFAKVMGISQKAVENMINTDPLEFMLKFSEGMKGMDATKTAKTLDYLGISADGANKVIGAMGNNTARFRELIDLSNKSFSDGTSLVNEYDIKNNNLAATLEKISKTVSGWFSSETFIKWLTIGVSWLANFIGATEEADKKVSGWRIVLAFTAKLLAVVIASMISFTVAARIAAIETKTLGVATAWSNLVSKLQIMWLTLQATALKIYSFFLKETGDEAAKTAVKIRALNIAGAASPWGIVIALVMAAAAAYFAFRDSVNKTVVAQESFATQQKKLADEVGKSTAATKAHLYSLVSIINDTNVSLETRKKAYEELVKIAPEFNGLIVKEGEKVTGLLTIYADYIAALDQVAKAKAYNKLNEANIDKEIQDNLKLYNAEKKLSIAKKELSDYVSKYKKSERDLDYVYGLEDLAKKQKLAQEEKNIANSTLDHTKKIIKNGNDFKTNTVKNLENNIKIREKNLADLEKQYGKEAAQKSSGYKQVSSKLKADKQSLNALIGGTSSTTPATSNYNGNLGGEKGGDSARKKQEAEEKKQLEDTQKFIDEKLKQERQAQDIRLSNMDDGAKKEIIIEQVNLDRKITDLEKGLIKEEDIKQAFANSTNEKLSKTDRAYWKGQAELWQATNDTKYAEMGNAVKLHYLKLGTIEEKAASDSILKSKEAFDNAKLLRETAFNEELAGLDISDKEKKKRQEEFNKQELLLESEYLKELLQKLDTIINSKQFEGIDLDLLTPEMRVKFQKQLDEVKKLRSALALEIQGGEPDKPNKEERNKDSKKVFEGLNGGADILGFTPDQWKQAYDNIDTYWGKLVAGTMIVQALQNAWGQYNQFLDEKENAQLRNFTAASDKKKLKLKRQLDSGMISQKTHDKQVAKLDKEVDKKKAEIEYKQAKRKKAMDIVNTVINTSVAIMQGYSQLGPIGGTIAAVLIGAMGALQIATIAKQPLPAKGYESGLYGDYVKREQDGKVFKSKYAGKTRSGLVSDTSHFLVAENGPEMVIDNKAWRQMNPEVKDSLIRELNGIKGFEKGLYNQDLKRYEVPAAPTTKTPSADNSQMLQMVLSVVAENTAVMKDLRDKGVFGVMTNKDLKSMGYLQDGLDAFNELRTKSKR